MIQRLSGPDASRWRQISTIFSRATLFSLLFIYVLYYGLALIPGSPSFLRGFAPLENGSVDPNSIVLSGVGFLFHPNLYLPERRLIGTLLFCLPLFCAAVTWITGTVLMAMQQRWRWVFFSIASVAFVILDDVFMAGILHAFHIRDSVSTVNCCWTPQNMVFWIAAIEELFILFVPSFVIYLYLIEAKSQGDRTREVALTGLASFILASLSLVITTTNGPFAYFQQAGGGTLHFTAGFPLPFIVNYPYTAANYPFIIPLYLLDVAFFYGVIVVVKVVISSLRQRLRPSIQRTQEAGAGAS
jgi:hypothetical protein